MCAHTHSTHYGDSTDIQKFCGYLKDTTADWKYKIGISPYKHVYLYHIIQSDIPMIVLYFNSHLYLWIRK